ncbi:MATE family efflux transporter [Spongiivirga sp. MCCC 1A20706]|uniref:MATE family efflux transporter n=1 Tax=Spongiivirga sp. MCCC 1A20706 TaxID=3160963 RepID=UPI0039775B6D
MKREINLKSINRLAIPAIISGIAEPILSATDTAVVGNIPEVGTESLAAVGIVGTFLSMLIWVLAQTRSAISAIISQYLGAGKLDAVRSLPMQAITFNISLSIIILITTIPFISEIFSFLEAKNEVLEYCISYYSIRVWGFPLTLLVFAIFGVFRGLQNTFWPMIISLVGVVANIILDFVLVYGIEGFVPAMNLEGAAWASLFSQIIMAVMSVLLLVKKTDVSFKLSSKWHPEMNRFLVMSGNLFVRAIALNTAMVIAVRQATSLGTDYIAAHTIAMQLWLFTAFFIDGYGAAGNILGGKLLGAKDYKNLLVLTKKICAYGLVVSLLLMAMGFIAYDYLGRIFSDDVQVLNIFRGFFYLAILLLPVNAIAFVLDGLFKGMGETGYLRNTLLGATFFAFVPTLVITQKTNMGIHGIWIAILVWIAFRAMALIYKFWKAYYPLAIV